MVKYHQIHVTYSPQLSQTNDLYCHCFFDTLTQPFNRTHSILKFFNCLINCLITFFFFIKNISYITPIQNSGVRERICGVKEINSGVKEYISVANKYLCGVKEKISGGCEKLCGVKEKFCGARLKKGVVSLINCGVSKNFSVVTKMYNFTCIYADLIIRSTNFINEKRR